MRGFFPFSPLRVRMTILRRIARSEWSGPPRFLVCCGYCCVGFFGYVVLLLPVADGGAEGVFGEDRTVDLDRRQGEFLDDVGVRDGEGLGDGLALDPLGGGGAGGDGRAAAGGLALRVLDDLGFGVDADLEAHDVTALRRADEAGTDFGGALVQGANVAGILVVVYYLVAICHFFLLVRRYWLDVSNSVGVRAAPVDLNFYVGPSALCLSLLPNLGLRPRLVYCVPLALGAQGCRPSGGFRTFCFSLLAQYMKIKTVMPPIAIGERSLRSQCLSVS